MPFKPGCKKPEGSGKKKGTPNKLTRQAIELLASMNCDPLEGMARIALNKRNPIELRAKMFAELAQYVYPKRKAIEHSGIGGGPIEFNNVSARDILASRIAGLAQRSGSTESNQQPV